MVDTEIKATFTADTQDFTRGTTRAAKDLVRVAAGADEATNQTNDLQDAVSTLAREFAKGARDAFREAKALERVSGQAKHTASQVDDLTGQARQLRRELQRVDGMNVEPDLKIGKVRGAFRGLHRGIEGIGGQLAALAGQIPAVGGALEKMGAAAPEAAAGIAAVAASLALLALPFALAGAAAAGALVIVGLLSKWVASDPTAATLRDQWSKVSGAFSAFIGLVKTQLVPVLTGIATAVAPAVVGVLQSLQTWWVKNKKAVEDFLVNLTKLGLQGVAAMASMSIGILKVLGPMVGWIVRAIGRMAQKFADWFRAMSHVPGFGWMKDIADDLDGIGDAAGPMADSIESASRAAQDALALVRDGALDAKTRMDQLDGNYNIFVDTWYRQHGVPPSGITGHPTQSMAAPPPVTGSLPAVAAGPAPAGRSGAPVLQLAQPSRRAGTVVNVDARGAVGLSPDALGKAVVAALERYEGKNGARWRGGTTRWRIA